MMYEIERNAEIDNKELHELSLSVGWPSDLERLKKEIQHCYSNFSTRYDGLLIGYVNTISDGVDALLNNLIVRLSYQKRGLGKALIKTAINELSKDGVKFFNVVFDEELTPFYTKCGFYIMRSGIIDLDQREK